MAKRNRRRNKISQATKLLRKVQKNPDDMSTLLVLYQHLNETRQYCRAIACMGRIIIKTMRVSDTGVYYRKRLAGLYLKTGRYDRALVIAKDGVKAGDQLNSRTARFYKYQLQMAIVDALDLMGRESEATDEYKEAAKFAGLNRIKTRPRLTMSVRRSGKLS